MNEKLKITVPPSVSGTYLPDFLAKLGYTVSADCGGRGICGKCKVKLISGTVLSKDGMPLLSDRDGYILSCRAVCSDTGAEIEISNHGDLTESSEKTASLPSDTEYGIALDIGTTTVVAALAECHSGKVIDTISKLNPQRSYGADVLSRIEVSSDKLDILCNLIRRCTRDIIEEFHCRHGKFSIKQMAVAGNPTMLHLFCGVSPVGIGRYPFTPEFLQRRTYEGEEFGIDVERIDVLASASAYIGSDITAGIFAVKMMQSPSPSLFIDLGTNGEMALWDKKRITYASTAAGPAFEGANISFGTGGIGGAIDHISILRHGTAPLIAYSTISDLSPVGICGAGLLDAVAVMLTLGIIDETGHMDEKPFSVTLGSIHKKADGTVIKDNIKSDITICAADIRNFQLAKGAVAAGIEILLNEAQLSMSDLGTVYVAGGLGYYLSEESAFKIGLFPESFRGKLRAVGNTSLAGAVLCLSGENSMSGVDEIAQSGFTLSLNDRPDFTDAFIEHLGF